MDVVRGWDETQGPTESNLPGTQLLTWSSEVGEDVTHVGEDVTHYCCAAQNPDPQLNTFSLCLGHRQVVYVMPTILRSPYSLGASVCVHLEDEGCTSDGLLGSYGSQTFDASADIVSCPASF